MAEEMKKFFNKLGFYGVYASALFFIIQVLVPPRNIGDSLAAFVVLLIIFGSLYLVTREKNEKNISNL
ncbi:MAG: hypothetical protein LBT96_02920 [Campylobacteraceae bacterium]|nr:hypothetical protein [Campylobacteraceae bacterium]